jgi:hypothetical protein
MKQLYLIETTSSFKIAYVVQTDKEPKNGRLQHIIDDGQLSEINQQFLGEKIVGIKPITKAEYLTRVQEIFPESEESPLEVKLAMVNDIDLETVEMLSDDDTK